MRAFVFARGRPASSELKIGLALVVASILLGTAFPALGQSFEGLGFPTGSTDSLALGISGDASTVIGSAGAQAFSWTAVGGMVGLSGQQALGVSTDGSVIVGVDGANYPVMWTGGSTTPTSIDFPADALIPFVGQAQGVSGDGSKIVGFEVYRDFSSHTHHEAFLWTAGGGTALLGGPTGGFPDSAAFAISSDGTTIVGQGYPSGTGFGAPSQPFYWQNSTTGKVAISDLTGGNTGFASAVNGDGSVIVGESTSSNTVAPFTTEAFRWDFADGTVGLGDLPGGSFDSVANAVSGDGSVVVGRGTIAGDVQQAFRWTSATGMVSVADYLSGLGVDLGTWSLASATGISADGQVMVGFGTDPGGSTEAWLARGAGLTTMSDFVGSLAPVNAAIGSGDALLSGSLTVADEVGRDYDCVARRNGHPMQAANCLYTVGAFEHAGDEFGNGPGGAIGLIHRFDPVIRAGIGVDVGTQGNSFADGGSVDATFAGVQGFLAYGMDRSGPQISLALSAGGLTVDTTRIYLNGVDPTAASGSTTGSAYGAEARLGWRFPVGVRASLTPFAAFTATGASLDGYAEGSAGPFPATFSSRTKTTADVALGAEMRAAISAQTSIWGSAAWHHRLGGETDPLGATLAGLFSVSVPGSTAPADALQLEAGFNQALTTQTTLTLTTRALLSDGATSVGVHIGFTHRG